jgi:molybdopterin biosynthesis enzyme
MSQSKQITAAIMAVLTAITIYAVTVYPQIKAIVCPTSDLIQQEKPVNHEIG